MPEPPQRRPPLVEAMRYTQIGLMLVAPMVVLGALGFYLDRRFDTVPWLLLAGLILGMAAGFLNFLRLVLPLQDSGARPGAAGGTRPGPSRDARPRPSEDESAGPSGDRRSGTSDEARSGTSGDARPGTSGD